MEAPEQTRRFETLVDIISKLRGPDGCPWDRKQTHASLRENLLEECYEVLDALDRRDGSALCEELGDLLLQIVLHARIASEAGDFDIGDVINSITTKLIRRHPHVFASVAVAGVRDVLTNWEEIKKKERSKSASMLDGIPKQMPALTYGQSLQKRAARVGFDWSSDEGVIDKLAEEVNELGQAGSQEEKEAEFGDIVFTMANIARRMGIDLESTLRETNRRFRRRFAYMEELCRRRNLEFAGLSLADKDHLWEEAKSALDAKDDGRGERT